jgi:predicted nucleic acid-binding Zn ribbon protein
MRRSEIHSLGSAIKSFLKESKFDRKLAEVDAVSSWESIIGKPIARATTSIYIKNETLYIHLNSSIVRNELFMMRNDILRAVNNHAGTPIVKAIVLK